MCNLGLSCLHVNFKLTNNFNTSYNERYGLYNYNKQNYILPRSPRRLQALNLLLGANIIMCTGLEKLWEREF